MWSKKGFTLVELLIVLTILGILAAVVIPNFIGFDFEARAVATKTNLKTLRTVIEFYRGKEGSYPSALSDLLDTTYVDAGVQRKYIKEIPKEMMSGRAGSDAVTTGTLGGFNPGGTGAGWYFTTDSKEVFVNRSETLGNEWGEYTGENPKDW